jgi:hypothetical protein
MGRLVLYAIHVVLSEFLTAPFPTRFGRISMKTWAAFLGESVKKRTGYAPIDTIYESAPIRLFSGVFSATVSEL